MVDATWSRRSLLKGAVGAGALAATGGIVAACSTDTSAPNGTASPNAEVNGRSGFAMPAEIESSAGVLRAELVCTSSTSVIGGTSVRTMTYGATAPGPTLRARPGDTLRITLVNNLAEATSGGGMMMGGGQGNGGMQGQGMSDNGTNLHTHGLHVSPSGNSDNVFLDVARGARQEYEIAIPADHWGGLNWYHPHRHGAVSHQVLGGMAGAIVIAGPLDEVPEVREAGEDLLVLQRIQDGPAMLVRMAEMHDDRSLSLSGNPLFTVNGVVAPQLQMRPGEVRRWRIVNADPIDYFDLTLLDAKGRSLPGGLKFLARDGMTLPKLVESDSHVMVPGNRFDVLVQAPATPGTFSLVGRTATGFGQPDVTFATVVVSGSPVKMGLPTKLPAQITPIPASAVTQRQVVEFGSWGNAMTVNGLTFDQGPSVVELKLGTVAEWEVRNLSDQPHAFHIHTNPFYVVAENGRPVAEPAFWDTYPIPPATGPTTPGSITVRMAPTDFTGKIVMHCHILPHEDAGMMAVVNLV